MSTDRPGRRRPLHGPAAPVLEGLFAAQGLRPGDWWPFLVQGEGKRLPGGIEAVSGFVLTRDGRVYGWWLDWEAAPGVGRGAGWDGRGQTGGADRQSEAAPPGRYVLDRWWRVEAPEREFGGDAEYRRARRRLGLEPGGRR